jgi:hypothetical protein
MHDSVDDWFKHIYKEGPITHKFDLYYFCLMMGLTIGQKEILNNGKDITHYFINDYKSSKHIILGSFLLAEMSLIGIESDDREGIKKIIGECFDPTTSSNLSDTGFIYLNNYANAGFNFILNKHPEKPRKVETFLQWYAKTISEQKA